VLPLGRRDRPLTLPHIEPDRLTARPTPTHRRQPQPHTRTPRPAPEPGRVPWSLRGTRSGSNGRDCTPRRRTTAWTAEQSSRRDRLNTSYPCQEESIGPASPLPGAAGPVADLIARSSSGCSTWQSAQCCSQCERKRRHARRDAKAGQSRPHGAGLASRQDQASWPRPVGAQRGSPTDPLSRKGRSLTQSVERRSSCCIPPDSAPK
jgi:hypothetical protein